MNVKNAKNNLYTARWYLNNKPSESQEIIGHVSAALVDLGDPVGQAPVEEEPERPDVSAPGQKLLWYPEAVRLDFDMPTRGVYAGGYPVGALVHHTAGRCDTEADMIATMKWGRDQGYAFFGIGPTGVVYQAHPLNRWGYHAGASTWSGLGSSLSNKLVGIEIAGAGSVDASGKAWFGQKFPPERLRKADPKIHGVSGTFVKFTQNQEEALLKLLRWLKANNPEVFKNEYVLGHHEVSPGRKNDPGGSLSMGMDGLRTLL